MVWSGVIPIFYSYSNNIRLGLWVQRLTGTLILFILGFVAPGIPKHGDRELLNVGDPVYQSEEGQVLNIVSYCHINISLTFKSSWMDV